ncbi:MAG: oligoendopeptidase F [Peptococcaceae bacterium]|jgi:oligoendopeptidase F|nr:oligoendopeptidase F [Peptococcaceae bacterium]
MTETKTNTLPKREEIPAKYYWQLEKIYATDDAWEQELAAIKAMLPKAADYQKDFSADANQLLATLTYKEELEQKLDKCYTYAAMRKDQDNANSKYQDMKNRIHSVAVEAGTAFSWFAPAVLALDPAALEAALATPALAGYRRYLEEITRLRPHTRPAAEEEILAMTGEISSATNEIFGMANNADIKFPFVKNAQGEEIELTHGNYINFMESSDRTVRKNAFTALYDTYGKQKNTWAALLSNSVKRDVFYAKVRNYPSALEAALFDEKIPFQVYDQLIATVRKNLPAFFDYLKIRKECLGVEKLHMYDVYAPILPESRAHIPYEEAVEMVKAGLHPLGKDYVDILSDGVANGWVDVMESAGKTSGAYSSGAYGTDPYVLMNYHGNLNSVFTLAHELGHSMHSYYSWHHQPFIYSYYGIFLAEIASTVNENLLCRHMLAHTDDREEKLSLINFYLEEFRGTVFRQTMFAEFEKIIHEEVERGGSLTYEKFSEIYYQLNLDYFGPDMAVDEAIALEWARIPHFYRGFYVYKYATGFSAAAALAQQILNEGEVAATRYKDHFLKSGSSKDPIDTLKAAGVDMTTPAPIQAAFDVFRGYTEELKSLL